MCSNLFSLTAFGGWEARMMLFAFLVQSLTSTKSTVTSGVLSCVQVVKACSLDSTGDLFSLKYLARWWRNAYAL